MPLGSDDPRDSEHPFNRESTHKFIKDENSIRITDADIGDIEMGSFDKGKEKKQKKPKKKKKKSEN